VVAEIVIAAMLSGLALADSSESLDRCAMMAAAGKLAAIERDRGRLPSYTEQELHAINASTLGTSSPSLQIWNDTADIVVEEIFGSADPPQQAYARIFNECRAAH
jgi:hypothetical protein